MSGQKTTGGDNACRWPVVGIICDLLSPEVTVIIMIRPDFRADLIEYCPGALRYDIGPELKAKL